MAKFNNAKLQLLLHQPKIKNVGKRHSMVTGRILRYFLDFVMFEIFIIFNFFYCGDFTFTLMKYLFLYLTLYS